MARFRKGTNDADGDGKKGGSLPNRSADAIATDLAAARVRYAHTGPTHASVEACERLTEELKRAGFILTGGGQMVKVKGAGPKTKTVKKVAPKAKTEKVEAPKVEAAKPEPKAAKLSPEQLAAQVEQADLDESVGRHPGGMEPPLSEDAKKAVLDAQFAEADAVGDPRRDEQAAILAVRGF